MCMELQMKKIELLGEILIDTWPIVVIVLSLTIVLAINAFSPKTVVLSEKTFKCIESEPYGLETRCVTYTRKVR